jgi:hypothetical protein
LYSGRLAGLAEAFAFFPDSSGFAEAPDSAEAFEAARFGAFFLPLRSPLRP